MLDRARWKRPFKKRVHMRPSEVITSGNRFRTGKWLKRTMPLGVKGKGINTGRTTLQRKNPKEKNGKKNGRRHAIAKSKEGGKKPSTFLNFRWKRNSHQTQPFLKKMGTTQNRDGHQKAERAKKKKSGGIGMANFISKNQKGKKTVRSPNRLGEKSSSTLRKTSSRGGGGTMYRKKLDRQIH